MPTLWLQSGVNRAAHVPRSYINSLAAAYKRRLA